MSDAPSPAPLGVRRTPNGGRIRVFGEHAHRIELCVYSAADPDRIVQRLPLEREDGTEFWSGVSPHLVPGALYGLRASGPRGPGHDFSPRRVLLDPYARGVQRIGDDEFRSVVVEDDFDWRGIPRPATPLEKTVIYEAHVKGLTKLNPHLPAAVRGTYAGLGHPTTVEALVDLGVTAVELLPVHAFTSERRLQEQGAVNYWGYNTLAFFAPHPGYATAAARRSGAPAVLGEFKRMVRSLHDAGLEVILDVVYNHTAEEGPRGPAFSFRGLDNRAYYRQSDAGDYIDTTGCGNSLDFSAPVVQRLVHDSVRYWAEECRIDGFRFDLAATLGRGEGVEFTRDHPLIRGLVEDPALAGVKLIAEPWDVGMGGWQTGAFPTGWSEWNDGYRNRAREFWLTDVASLRWGHEPPSGVQPLASLLAGSAETFGVDRAPLASVNFITAHDGFTLADLTAYEHKHNRANGEDNRDGTDDNRSWNHGIEGDSIDERILLDRRRAMRNLLGTLLLSAGVPMITAGDEVGRTQRGNNNAYCHDTSLTWLPWVVEEWQEELRDVVRTLIRLRMANPALRPVHHPASADTGDGLGAEAEWYNVRGDRMGDDDWHSPATRTLQYLATALVGDEPANRILLVVNGRESTSHVTLPVHDGVDRWMSLWDSADDAAHHRAHLPGATITVTGPSLRLLRAA